MVKDNLGLFLTLYYRPLAAMSGLIDQGSWLFGGVTAIVAGLMFQAAVVGPLQARLVLSSLQASRALGMAPLRLLPASPFAALTGLVALAVLYVPATLFVMIFLERLGSFSVALQRHYGPLLTCTLMGWAAAHLPAAFAGLAVTAHGTGLGAIAAVWIASTAAFAAYMICALRTAVGARTGTAAVAVALSWVSLLFESSLLFLASPFALYWAWPYLRGEFGDLGSAFSRQRSFKRYLEAATVNPRDADAHYQLGLIELQRRRHDEAIVRFKQAVAIDQGELDAHLQLGRIAFEQGRFAEAVESFEAILARDEKHAQSEGWRDVGAAYAGAGRLEESRAALERYTQRRPYDPEGLYHLGATLAALDEKRGAREAFERCLEAVRTMPDHRRSEVRRWGKQAETALRKLPERSI